MLEPGPEELRLPLDAAGNRCELSPLVAVGESVRRGAVIAEGSALCVHAPVTGTVIAADAAGITLHAEVKAAEQFEAPPSAPDAAGLVDFVRSMGLVGMGGSQFPAAIKLAAAHNIHSLVINAVECEPGIQIDEALLLQEAATVCAGRDMLVQALGIERTVLALKQSARARITASPPWDAATILAMPDVYPGGAEKLIVRHLDGRMPPTGVLPVHRGYLVFSVASLWALGRRLLYGEPSILRPLTVIAPGTVRNLLVPVGTAVAEVLAACGIAHDPQQQHIVSGGMMMGRPATPDSPVHKGTNAIFVQPISARLLRTESPCILCGACYDVCPLSLHPSGMAERVRQRRASPALTAQLEECFLCAACSAVCPADIPLVQIFHEGKAWLRT